VIEEMADRFAELVREISLVLVEQHLDLALRVASHAYVLDRGRVALTGPSAGIRGDGRLLSILRHEVASGVRQDASGKRE
jgi:urea transport system ATP-binding protein